MIQQLWTNALVVVSWFNLFEDINLILVFHH